ncbi:putative Swr1p complex component [Taphrina deformans PYCC 5710]|uniref:SWR1-complex protein 5 n=1 Tax=Taphrina deformans (strain PYCC 5710 / ATCC 11124 / CBS 356.35 / IMI 108563 / JCM 9778 / NBRC 8474) TaxID=1097556 RepID=R4XFG7_TAPDE|nr:putative Swr1p complex component [Taphrina deformans PYCC 5710]|eukprot:CCG83211.1 putative Swr1p complex component [Taphrina deformans PYCC 5710]
MPDMTKAVTIDPRMEASDDSEDEDYNPNQPTKSKTPKVDGADDAESDSGSEQEDKLGDYDSGDEKTIGKDINKKSARAKADAEQLGTEGGLIKTRAQRAQESREEKSVPAASNSGTSKTDIDALWAALNSPTPTPTASTSKVPPADPTAEETVTINRTYEFAGDVHTEVQVVPKDSQAAKDYLAQQAAAAAGTPATATAVRTNDAGLPLRRVVKRKSTLDAGGTKVQKINTLEKSRMEWSSFVDREGINEDLKRGNKAGYLDKQEFLDGAERAKYSQWKAGQKKP